MDGTSKDTISKDTEDSTIDQTGPTDVYKTFHSTGAEYTFLSSAHSFSSIDNVLSQNNY